jgi:hypothetical protein
MEWPPEWRPHFEYMNGVVKIFLKPALIFSGGKNVSTIILRARQNFTRR